jgi:hypothetical protein
MASSHDCVIAIYTLYGAFRILAIEITVSTILSEYGAYMLAPGASASMFWFFEAMLNAHNVNWLRWQVSNLRHGG